MLEIQRRLEAPILSRGLFSSGISDAVLFLHIRPFKKLDMRAMRTNLPFHLTEVSPHAGPHRHRWRSRLTRGAGEGCAWRLGVAQLSAVKHKSILDAVVLVFVRKAPPSGRGTCRRTSRIGKWPPRLVDTSQKVMTYLSKTSSAHVSSGRRSCSGAMSTILMPLNGRAP